MAARTKKRPARHREETYFAVGIESWDWDYSFGINNTPKLVTGPYQDYRHLHVRGTLSRPRPLSGTAVELTFVPARDLRDAKYRSDPAHVGTFNIERKTKALKGLLSIPEDVLSTLLPMFIAGRLQFAVLASKALFRGSAPIRSYRFSATLDPDDLPPEE